MSLEWERGFADGFEACYRKHMGGGLTPTAGMTIEVPRHLEKNLPSLKQKRKRKLSAWNKFVKANSKKKRFIYQSGSKRGKLNLRKMGVAFRKTPAGRKRK
jgi:hypothetical protein